MSVIKRVKKKRVQKTKWSIVLAEDDDDYALLIEQALEKAADVPVEIRRARNGEQAITLMRELAPDLLLLDLNMPGMAGHDALELIKGDSRLRPVPVVVLTVSDRGEDIAKSYGLGGNHFITKPKDPQELERKLRALLKNLPGLRRIRRGSAGASTTAVSATDRNFKAVSTVPRWAIVVGVLVALYFFGRLLGVF